MWVYKSTCKLCQHSVFKTFALCFKYQLLCYGMYHRLKWHSAFAPETLWITYFFSFPGSVFMLFLTLDLDQVTTIASTKTRFSLGVLWSYKRSKKAEGAPVITSHPGDRMERNDEKSISSSFLWLKKKKKCHTTFLLRYQQSEFCHVAIPIQGYWKVLDFSWVAIGQSKN